MPILYKTDGAIARITLNRPDKRNALNDELIEVLKDTLALAAEDEQVRVVLIAGAGKDFCAGADLEALDRTAEAGVLHHLATAHDLAGLLLAIRHHPKPVIAAVDGRALAGGCGLATACDVILASESAYFGYPEVKIGFVAAMVMAILRRSVGEKKAFDLLASGEPICAAEAERIGLITRAIPRDAFETEVEKYANAIAAKPASAIALTKSLLYHIDGMTFDAAIEAGVRANAIARMTDAARLGIERFARKK
ncbi:MAG TPA: enoyl-CoA hydratase-related protein [Bryobacteraceae bacterium]|nr:enoyl-CoA hydratase-related protein [Bryobacteraceae bacterium]